MFKTKQKNVPLVQCFGGVLLNIEHFFKLLTRNYGIINLPRISLEKQNITWFLQLD